MSQLTDHERIIRLERAIQCLAAITISAVWQDLSPEDLNKVAKGLTLDLTAMQQDLAESTARTKG